MGEGGQRIDWTAVLVAWVILAYIGALLFAGILLLASRV